MRPQRPTGCRAAKMFSAMLSGPKRLRSWKTMATPARWASCSSPKAVELAAVPFQGPAVGLMDPGQDMHEGTLARAVLSHQGMDLAAADLQVDAVERPDAREPLADRAGDQQGAGRDPGSPGSLVIGPSLGVEPREGVRAQCQCASSPDGRMCPIRAPPGIDGPPRHPAARSSRRAGGSAPVSPGRRPAISTIARGEIGQQDAARSRPGVAPARRRPGGDSTGWGGPRRRGTR